MFAATRQAGHGAPHFFVARQNRQRIPVRLDLPQVETLCCLATALGKGEQALAQLLVIVGQKS